MSTKNFIPTLWNDAIFQGYDENFVFTQLANRSYEGQVQEMGDSVRVNEIGDITSTAYTGSISWTEVDDAQKVLLIDQQHYIAKTLGDIDAIQAKPKLMGEITRKMGIGMSDTIDTSMANLYAQAGITDGSTGSPDEVLSTTILHKISEMSQAFDENNVPQDRRVMVVHPWFVHKLRIAGLNTQTNNIPLYNTGFVGEVLGWDVFQSNNCANSSTTWYANYFFRQGDSIALAEQLKEMEVVRREDSFSDGVRQLAVWGVKVMAPESFGIMYNTNGAT